MINLNLAGLNTFYVKNQKEYTPEDFPENIKAIETYTKDTKSFSIGVDIKF
jgi:hypothetical protein